VAKRPRPDPGGEAEGRGGGGGDGGGGGGGGGCGPTRSLAVDDGALDLALLEVIENALPLPFLDPRRGAAGVVMVHRLGTFPADEAEVHLWRKCRGYKNKLCPVGFRGECTWWKLGGSLADPEHYMCEVEVQEGRPLFVVRNTRNATEVTRGNSANEALGTMTCRWNRSSVRNVEDGPRIFGYGLLQDILALLPNAEKFFGKGFAEGRLARRKAAQETFQRACKLRDKMERGELIRDIINST